MAWSCETRSLVLLSVCVIFVTEGSQGRSGVTLGDASSWSLEVSSGHTMLLYTIAIGGISTPLSDLSLKESITEVSWPCNGLLRGHLTHSGVRCHRSLHFTCFIITEIHKCTQNTSLDVWFGVFLWGVKNSRGLHMCGACVQGRGFHASAWLPTERARLHREWGHRWGRWGQRSKGQPLRQPHPLCYYEASVWFLEFSLRQE